jgi:tetratricopeptide (TPR) repeat protein
MILSLKNKDSVMVNTMANKDVELYYKKALEFLEKKEYDKSLKILEMVLNIDKKYLPAWNCKGVVYLEKKDYPGALASFEEVIQLNAGDNMAWYNKGYVLLLMGEYEQSKKVFDYFLARYENKNDDFYKYGLYLRAKSCYGLKDYENALFSLDECIKMDKNFQDAQDLKNTIKK